MIGYIYRISNINTDKSYVGITSDFKRRKKKHITELNNNIHHSPKLQNAWNYWGESCFEWTVREVEISSYEDLYELEIAEIKKFNSYEDGYNCNSGGKIQDWKQTVRNEDIVRFLCIQWKYGDGYGKTCEEIFGWAKGTASAAKRKIRYIDANIIFEKLTVPEKEEIATSTFNELKIKEKAIKRQLTQGGEEKIYSLQQDSFNFAFCAQELGYSYTSVGLYLNIKPTTVCDWFRGRSRNKEKAIYLKLNNIEKEDVIKKVKEAHLEAIGQDKLINKKEEDLISFLCYDLFYETQDAKIQRLYGWSEGTCYGIRQEGRYPITKEKVKLLSENEKKEKADNLHLLIGCV